MSDRVDKDLRLLRSCVQGKWRTDCSNRIFVLVPTDPVELPFHGTEYQVGEMYADLDAQAVVAMGNHAVRYVELAQELETVVLPQLKRAVSRVPDECKEELLAAKYYVEQLLLRVEQ